MVLSRYLRSVPGNEVCLLMDVYGGDMEVGRNGGAGLTSGRFNSFAIALE
jgi:hypothetical protein